MIFCQKCGTRLQDDAKFCAKCGAPTSIEPNPMGNTSVTGVSNEEEHLIWNPNAASNWSLIFTPAFGSYLHACNWRVLGEKKRAHSAMGWFYFSLFMLVVYIFMGMVDGRAAESAEHALGLFYLIIWYFVVGRSQAKYVKEKFGNEYSHRGWGKPLLIGVAAIIGYLFVAMVIGFAIGMLTA